MEIVGIVLARAIQVVVSIILIAAFAAQIVSDGKALYKSIKGGKENGKDN